MDTGTPVSRPPDGLVHPDYPPRARIEWIIAGARAVLAVGGLIAIWLDPSTPPRHEYLTYALLAIYIVYSLGTLALVWKPVEFARTSGTAAHVFDLLAFLLFMSLTEGASSPFFIYFVFSVICGALRWDAAGALITAAAALSAYSGLGVYEHFTNPLFQPDRFIIRGTQLTVVAVLVAYLSSYHPRTVRELLRFASWPHVLPRDERDAADEILGRATEVLPAPRILLVWKERDEEYVNLAWRDGKGLEWLREPGAAYEPLVLPRLRAVSFQAGDAADPTGHVDSWDRGRFRYERGAPVHEALRQRFDMHAVQSSRIEASVVEGRLFWLDRRRMRLDDLVVGDLVARFAASRLESARLLASLRETSALNERLRLARDLHDSVLQALAGTGLQLAVARRLLDRDPDGARRALQEVENQLELSEHEMRALIRRLRPAPREPADAAPPGLLARLLAFRSRIEAQWQVGVVLQVAPVVDELAAELQEQMALLVQEAVLNAAKHAEASTIRVVLDSDDRMATIEVTDDGKGFAFTGSHDLRALMAANTGPLTLRERVTDLRGDLQIHSSSSGASVRIALPLIEAAPAHHGYVSRAR